MKEHLARAVHAAQTPLQGRNLTREYLQARILGSFQRAGAMVPLAFHGGTSLRFLYGIPRYSEDLDFTLEQAQSQYDFRGYLQVVRTAMASEGYTVALKVNDEKTVNSAFIGFQGLLHELNLSPHANETLSIKIEVDTNPPEGVMLAVSVVRRHVILRLQHHDRASLFAGKLHAVLQRPYPKGRDMYDLLWYLSDPSWPPPNFELLNNALQQTGWKENSLTTRTWKPAVIERLQELDWSWIHADVRPFIESEHEIELLSPDTLLHLLAHKP